MLSTTLTWCRRQSSDSCFRSGQSVVRCFVNRFGIFLWCVVLSADLEYFQDINTLWRNPTTRLCGSSAGQLGGFPTRGVASSHSFSPSQHFSQTWILPLAVQDSEVFSACIRQAQHTQALNMNSSWCGAKYTLRVVALFCDSGPS